MRHAYQALLDDAWSEQRPVAPEEGRARRGGGGEAEEAEAGAGAEGAAAARRLTLLTAEQGGWDGRERWWETTRSSLKMWTAGCCGLERARQVGCACAVFDPPASSRNWNASQDGVAASSRSATDEALRAAGAAAAARGDVACALASPELVSGRLRAAVTEPLA